MRDECHPLAHFPVAVLRPAAWRPNTSGAG